MPTAFSEVLASVRPEDDAFRATVTDDWAQGRATFGGLVAAVGNEVLRRLVPADRPLRSLQTTFIGPAGAGEWAITGRVLRVGKAVTLASCEIREGGHVVATLTGVYGFDRPSRVQIRPQIRPTERAVNDLQDMRFVPGVAPNFVQHFAVRWAHGARPFSGSDVSSSSAYVRHRDGGALTESHVVALIDAIPTPALQMLTAAAPASSLVWTLEFFEHDFPCSNEQFWRLDTQIDAATAGYVNQTTLVAAPSGQPVGLSRQLFAVFG
jgi:acyl-CoA thioesterase